MNARIPAAALLSCAILAGSTFVAEARKADDHHGEHAGATVTKAIAVLQPTEGNDTSGTVTFTKVEDGILVKAEVRGLSPGKHGFHVHQLGDLSAPDGTSAGGHFNPAGAPHAGPDAEHRHVGDLGNIEANEEGVARLGVVDPRISFEGPNSILGRAVIIHGGADDLESQPSGDAGPRVAGGVVGIAAEE
jgi:Cu-Zn family superoxide dismutase